MLFLIFAFSKRKTIILYLYLFIFRKHHSPPLCRGRLQPHLKVNQNTNETQFNRKRLQNLETPQVSVPQLRFPYHTIFRIFLNCLFLWQTDRQTLVPTLFSKSMCLQRLAGKFIKLASDRHQLSPKSFLFHQNISKQTQKLQEAALFLLSQPVGCATSPHLHHPLRVFTDFPYLLDTENLLYSCSIVFSHNNSNTCFCPNTAPMFSFKLGLPVVDTTELFFPWPTWLVQLIRTPFETTQYACSTWTIFAYSYWRKKQFHIYKMSLFKTKMQTQNIQHLQVTQKGENNIFSNLNSLNEKDICEKSCLQKQTACLQDWYLVITQ